MFAWYLCSNIHSCYHLLTIDLKWCLSHAYVVNWREGGREEEGGGKREREKGRGKEGGGKREGEGREKEGGEKREREI